MREYVFYRLIVVRCLSHFLTEYSNGLGRLIPTKAGKFGPKDCWPLSLSSRERAYSTLPSLSLLHVLHYKIIHDEQNPCDGRTPRRRPSPLRQCMDEARQRPWQNNNRLLRLMAMVRSQITLQTVQSRSLEGDSVQLRLLPNQQGGRHGALTAMPTLSFCWVKTIGVLTTPHRRPVRGVLPVVHRFVRLAGRRRG